MLRASSVFYRHLDEEVLGGLEGLVGSGRLYLIAEMRGSLAKRWGLIVPDNFKNMFRGV